MRHLVLLFILILYTISLSSWARKPAVEPQMGISNEFRELSPKVAKGFEFSENINRAPTAINKAEHSNSSTTATTFLVLLILIAPLLLWATIQWKAKNRRQISNVFPFHSQEEDHNDSDQDWPQAS